MRIPQDSGTPYPGSLQRLIRIHREAAPGSTIRSVVLYNFLCYDFAQGLAALRAVAISDDRTAMMAMDLLTLAASHGTCGITANQQQIVRANLREVYERNLAQQTDAVRFLNAFAFREGWRR
jgi:hypothetical protein